MESEESLLKKQIVEKVLAEGGLVDADRVELILQEVKKGKTISEAIVCIGQDSEPPQEEKGKKDKQPSPKAGCRVVFSYSEESKKRTVQDFTSLFNARYKAIESMLANRQVLQGLNTIIRIQNKKTKETAAFIGMIAEKHTTKSGSIILTLEDATGEIKAVATKSKMEVYETAKDCVLDEVVGVTGQYTGEAIFPTNIILPEVSLNKELKKADEQVYAAFISDLHIGSKNFLSENFNKFIKWLNGSIGNEKQKKQAEQVKYIFIVGDLIDGVGVYPEQDSELSIKDIYLQYKECAEYLGKIPQDKKIIICPGNHDALRIAEPQPQLYKDFAKPLWMLPNVVMLSNPAIVNIHANNGFPGFDVLLYHGYSFDYYASNVGSIRESGGYDRADLIMKFLLRRRHLAPAHTSTLYLPIPSADPLVISRVPDFFVAGHIHKTMVSNYRNITMICGGCWQSKTSFQEKVGHHPEPCKVPLVDLQTRRATILKF